MQRPPTRSIRCLLPDSGFLAWAARRRSEEEAAKPVAKPAAAPPVSTYAPGHGLIEEEIIEEEEFEAPRHHPQHDKAEDHDLDNFEEETLPTQIRSGDLGEMLQEAHLDHRLELNFDEKNGDEDEDTGEESSTESQPSAESSHPAAP